jgi:hypothetical protein
MAVHLVGQTELVWAFGQACPAQNSQLLKYRHFTHNLGSEYKRLFSLVISQWFETISHSHCDFAAAPVWTSRFSLCSVRLACDLYLLTVTRGDGCVRLRAGSVCPLTIGSPS